MNYSNENTQRTIRAFDRKHMELDDGSKWHFSVQEAPSNWAVEDKVVVEKAGMMYRIRNLFKKSDGIATLMMDAAQAPTKSVKRELEPILDQELVIVKLYPDGLIELNEGPNYRPGGINPAKTNIESWERGDIVKVIWKNSPFGIYELKNITRKRSMDIIQDK